MIFLFFFWFQDVVSKIMTFLQQGSLAVCILSACGVISKVTFQQAMTSSETTYEVCDLELQLICRKLISCVQSQKHPLFSIQVICCPSSTYLCSFDLHPIQLIQGLMVVIWLCFMYYRDTKNLDSVDTWLKVYTFI